jgi:hypothetical protein
MRSTFLGLSSLLIPALSAQITVTTAPGNQEQTFFKLSDETATTRPQAEWDLAFEINGGFSAGVLVNTAKGMLVYQAPYAVADWNTVDTNGLASSWTELQNSDTSWSWGALNQGISGEFDLGWGIYNMITHVVVGDSIYVVKTSAGDWKKLRIDALGAGTYSFTYAALDGSAPQTGSIAKADYTGKNFAYWSFDTNAAVDREPLSADWDLVFTKYITNVGMWYGVTGALQNKGVGVVQVNGLPPDEVTDPWASAFDPLINTIGYDWKVFDMGTFTYVIDDSLIYFVKDIPGNVWKIVFTAYGGSSTGDITFTKDLMSAAGVTENPQSAQLFSVFPNPVTGGSAQIVIDAPAGKADLTIMDMNGRTVKQDVFSNAGGLTGRIIDLRGMAPGLYTLRLDYGSSISSTRLAIE